MENLIKRFNPQLVTVGALSLMLSVAAAFGFVLAKMKKQKFFLGILLVFIPATTGCLMTDSNASSGGAAVTAIRTPEGGLAPEVLLDKQGVLHMVYGRDSDGYYVQSHDGGKTFTTPVKLNQRPDIVTVGGERGPKIAIGKDGAIHVAWLGRGAGIWYTRSTNGGRTFQPERNMLDTETGTDEATIAADQDGNVFVLWLDGRLPGDSRNPGSTPIFMAVSKDNGATFSANQPLRYQPDKRACSCCRMEASIGNDGYLYVAFRTGYQNIRDFYLLKGRKTENNFRLVPVSVDNWELEACPMSGPSFAVEDNGQVLISWMSRYKVYWSISNSEAMNFAPRVATPQGGEGENHPVVLTNHKGEVLLVWREGAQVNWAKYTMDGKFTGNRGTAGKLNGHSKPEAFLGADGNFYVVL